MAVVFTPGQALTKNDLNIFIRNSQNEVFDPHYITFSIVDSDGNSIFIDRIMSPHQEATGYFWAKLNLPTGLPIGTYSIQWFVKDTEASPLQQIEQKFGVVHTQDRVTFTPTIGGVVYYPGQSLTPQDLYIIVRNHLGNQTDPYEITYEVFQRISGMEILISPMRQKALRLGVGHYYANYQIPSDAIPGEYFIKWGFKETPTGDTSYATQEFAVVSGNVLVQSPYGPKETTLIRKLRFMLRDNNPDRNYHFMPPASEETIQGFTQKFGFVWEDEELYEYLDIAVSDLNNMPPIENWTLSGLSERLYSLVLCNAAAIAMRALAINWAHEEWQGDISGVGLNLEKSSKYLSIKENFESSYARQLTEYKEFGVRYIVGIRQPRYGIGVTSALGPYSRTGVQNRRNYIGSS